MTASSWKLQVTNQWARCLGGSTVDGHLGDFAAEMVEMLCEFIRNLSGVAPLPEQWQITVYCSSGFPTKIEIILVVTVAGRGPHPRYLSFSLPAGRLFFFGPSK